MSSDVLSVEAFAAGLSSKVLACRERNHTWKPVTVEVIHTGRGRRGRIAGYVRILRCPQCTTMRRQTIDSTGHPLSNSYTYPEGYLATNVEAGVTRDAFRIEALTRFIDEHGTDSAVSHVGGTNVPAPLRLVS